jgi:hypothetical protein
MRVAERAEEPGIGRGQLGDTNGRECETETSAVTGMVSENSLICNLKENGKTL